MTRIQLTLAACIVSVGTALLGLPSTGLAEGAIAKSDDGYTGMSYNYRSQREADNRALGECDGRCRIVYRFRNTCAAVAVGDRGGGGWASGSSVRRADDAALEQCEAQGNRRCRVKQHNCDE